MPAGKTTTSLDKSKCSSLSSIIKSLPPNCLVV
jgi:hypothetical protein